MGLGSSGLTWGELEEYKELTYLTKNEIMHLYHRYNDLLNHDEKRLFRQDINSVRLPRERALEIPELNQNPFGDRICSVFSSADDSSLSFEDLLDLASAFSDGASKKLKVAYAFRIYDFDDKDELSREDLTEVINRLVRHTGDDGSHEVFSEAEMDRLIDSIFAERMQYGIDRKTLHFLEFASIIDRTPEFMECFRIRF